MRLARTQFLLLMLTGALLGLSPRAANAEDNDGDSPVQTFRKLLTLSPAEQEAMLGKYSPATRERIQAKVLEYQKLPPDFRELRLEVTELRWYLLPLMQTPPTNRAEQLKSVPETYRAQVAARLEEWDIFPPTLKEEILQYRGALSTFVGRDAAGKMVIQPKTDLSTIPVAERRDLETKLAGWQALSETERNQIYGSFEHFLELSESEKQKTLDALDAHEKQETEKILLPVEKWPREQQQQYLSAFRKFSAMSPEARQQFLKNVQRWQKMSPAERQAWRDLDRQLADTPPLPPDVSVQVKPVGPIAIPRPSSNTPASR